MGSSALEPEPVDDITDVPAPDSESGPATTLTLESVHEPLRLMFRFKSDHHDLYGYRRLPGWDSLRGAG